MINDLPFTYNNCDINPKFMTVYPFTNEYLSLFMPEFDLKNKSLLTVGSSGDQILNAILLDCNDITHIDINPYSKFYYYFKIAALTSLDLDEFIKFFLVLLGYPIEEDVTEYHNKTIKKIMINLKKIDNESYEFWSNLYKKYNFITIYSCLFHSLRIDVNELIFFNLYLQNDNQYNTLKEKILGIHPRFINGDILKTYLTNEQFDNIILSNISTYILGYNQLDTLINTSVSKLKDHGLMQLGYFYDYSYDSKDFFSSISPIYNVEELKKRYQDLKFILKRINTNHDFDYKSEDAVLLLKK